MQHCVIKDENIAGFMRAIGLTVAVFRIPLDDMSVFDILIQRGELALFSGAGTYLLVSDKEHRIEIASSFDVRMELEKFAMAGAPWEYVLALSPEIGGDLRKMLTHSQQLKRLLFDALNDSVLMYEVKLSPETPLSDGQKSIVGALRDICDETMEILPLLGFPEITPPENVPEEQFPEFQHDLLWPSGWKNWKIRHISGRTDFSPTVIAPAVFREMVSKQQINERILKFLLSKASGEYFRLTSHLPALRTLNEGVLDKKNVARYIKRETFSILGEEYYFSKEWWACTYLPLMAFIEKVCGWNEKETLTFCERQGLKKIQLSKEVED